MERIIIIVRDEIGVIAGVARALADRGINIESLDTERAGSRASSPSPPTTRTGPCWP